MKEYIIHIIKEKSTWTFTCERSQIDFLCLFYNLIKYTSIELQNKQIIEIHNSSQGVLLFIISQGILLWGNIIFWLWRRIHDDSNSPLKTHFCFYSSDTWNSWSESHCGLTFTVALKTTVNKSRIGVCESPGCGAWRRKIEVRRRLHERVNFRHFCCKVCFRVACPSLMEHNLWNRNNFKGKPRIKRNKKIIKNALFRPLHS